MLGGPIIDKLGEDAHPAAYGQVGSAIDYRIRYHFGYAPERKLVARHGAALLNAWRDRRRVALRRVSGLPLRAPLTQACLDSFFGDLDSAIAEIRPYQRAPTQAEERVLARFCLVLAALEAVWRSPLAWPPPWLGDLVPRDSKELLSLVPSEWVGDAVGLATAFSRMHTDWRDTEAFLNPEFAGSADVGGADADFISEGCLWDIKAHKGHGASSAWLYQLVGYVLLDYEDAYTIDRVGLLFMRHRTMITWPIEELITAMSGGTERDLAILRARFRALLAEHPELSGDVDR